MAETGRFRRKKEDFDCDACGTHVEGSGYTDHCPNCLTGKHVDNNPGDRASQCKGTMAPVRTHYENSGFVISYLCIKCGAKKNMKAARDDNKELLDSLVSVKQ